MYCTIGPPSWPFIGCAIQIGILTRKFKHFQVFEQLCKQYGSVIGLQAGVLYTGEN